MNLKKLLQEFNFNPSKFIVYNCLLVFVMLLSLRLDETIKISYWVVFLPLFVYIGIYITVALVGIWFWLVNPTYRLTDASYVHFKSMLISLSIQLLLLMFELLTCDKLESGRHLWVLVFIPLIFISLLSIAICFWAMKNERSFELELFCAVNIVQFIFIALRLDHFINWSWVIVFVPLWIIMCLSIIGCLYSLIFFLIIIRSPEVGVEQRKASLHTAISYSLVVIPFLIFLFFSSSLSSFQQMSYFSVCMPLYFVFIILICLSFGNRGGNSWWFGIRKDLLKVLGTFLLSTCPCLREYANISYNKQTQMNSSNTSNSSANLESNLQPPPQAPDVYKAKLNNFPKNSPIMPTLEACQPD